MKLFGKRLKNLRLSKGLTVEQLAIKVGVTDIAIIHCEKGHYAINIPKMILLAKYFNVTMDYLLGLKNGNKKL